MYKIIDREKYDMYLEMLGYETLNIRGILKNTTYDAYVDDLDEPTGIFIKDGYFYFIYSENQTFIEAFDDYTKDQCFIGFSGCNKAVYDYFHKHIIQWSNPCFQYHYSGDYIKPSISLDNLKLSDAEFVDENYEYKNDHSLEKIRSAIVNRPTSCVRKDGKLIAFVLLHDDDSIGYMYTLPEYRKQGYAYELTKDIVCKTIDSARLPYIQIITSNEKSKGLAVKAGFKEHGIVYWFGIMRREHEIYKAYLKRYGKAFGIQAKSLIPEIDIEDIPVEVSEDCVKYENTIYPWSYFIYDENLFVKSDMPNEILLAAFKKLKAYMMFTNQEFDGFNA